MSRAEKLRQEVIASGSPLSKHSLSQRRIRLWLDTEKKVLGDPNCKGSKADRKRQATQAFTRELPRQQFDRCLSHLIDGNPTPEETSYFLKHAGEYERSIGIDGIDGRKVTIVDFTRTSAE